MEVYNSDAWGVVCGELWDKVDANVVCRMLGYGGAVAYQQNITFEQKNDTVWLSRVQCIGNESSLSQCAHAGWGKHTCNSSQAAGVTCLGRDRSEYVSLFYSITVRSDMCGRMVSVLVLLSTGLDLFLIRQLVRGVFVH